MHSKRAGLFIATIVATANMQPAHAQDAAARMDAIENQIKLLQAELKRVRGELAVRDGQIRAAQTEASRGRTASPAQAAAKQPETSPNPAAPVQTVTAPMPPPTVSPAQSAQFPTGTFKLGAITVTLGGFVAGEGVYRTRNITADIGSSYTAIPLAQSPNSHTGEFRGSARQSRISLLAVGDVSPAEKLAAYYESDFLTSGTPSNSNESNSYALRIRQAYLTYDNTDIGFHVLAGQAWSLATLYKAGLVPRQENVPLTIDAQYVPGFNWKRQWQVRVDKDMFDHSLWLAASIEEPQSTYAAAGPNGSTGLPSATTVTNTNPGGSLLNATNNYSDDIAPDLIVKAALEPGWGHYEAYGLGRLFHDRVSVVGDGHNNTVVAGGVGGGAILPLVPHLVDFQLSGLAGYGIGSYGSGQLPDAVLSSTGSPRALPEYTLLAGLVGHPTPLVDVYLYGGTEQVSRSSFKIGGKPYGYGNPLYAEGGCEMELTAAATCVGNTSGLTQGSVGGWWRFLKGNFGTLQAGLQYSYTRRDIFAGVGTKPGTSVTPFTDDNMIYFSFRYSPFQ